MYSSLEVETKSFEDLNLKFCGMQQCTSHYSYGPAIRKHHLIHYCLSGKGTYHVNNKVYHIKKGEAFLIMPHVVTYYQADEDDPWCYAWIGFDGTKTNMYLERCHLNETHLIIHSEYINEIRESIIAILAHNKLSYANELFIQGQLFNFFSYLAKSANIVYKEESETHCNPYVNKAIEYIQNNYQNKLTVNEIAEYLSLNRSYFTALFKKHLHMSPQEFLLRYRMTQAEDFLANTDLTINQIAFSCGYGNQLSFSKAFHKTHDMAPSEFRQKHKLVHKTRTEDPHQKKNLHNGIYL